MIDLSGLRVAVAGAGVFGLTVALRAAAAGAAVQVWDPAPLADNASGVAAGMIAPMGEALFDPDDAAPIDLLRAGRDGWAALEALADGLRVQRSGAVFLFEREGHWREARTRLRALGDDGVATVAESPPPSAAETFKFRLTTQEDWRIDAPSALRVLQAAVRARGGVFKAARLSPADIAAFDVVILAGGLESQTFAALAPELSALSPIKGQIVRFSGGSIDSPILRTADLYIAPQADGVLAGATMEPGRDDRVVSAAAIAALHARAVRLMPALRARPFTGLAGVRAATPDGLPLAGPSSHAALFLATGARRNGWLLAPLVSQILLSYLSGGDGGPFAAALDPRRFARA